MPFLGFVHNTEEFRPGSIIIKQGDTGTGFYVLEKGAVEVYKDDVMLNVLMYPGTIFGEMGDILGKPRSCTVKARSGTVVSKYNADDMENVIRDHPDIAIKIFRTLASRLERTTQKLADVSRISTVWAVKNDKNKRR